MKELHNINNDLFLYSTYSQELNAAQKNYNFAMKRVKLEAAKKAPEGIIQHSWTLKANSLTENLGISEIDDELEIHILEMSKNIIELTEKGNPACKVFRESNLELASTDLIVGIIHMLEGNLGDKLKIWYKNNKRDQK
jgi:hypothetical protein